MTLMRLLSKNSEIDSLSCYINGELYWKVSDIPENLLIEEIDSWNVWGYCGDTISVLLCKKEKGEN